LAGALTTVVEMEQFGGQTPRTPGGPAWVRS